MQVDLIAEGVESQPQADWLLAAGCVLQQGFLYARPMEATDLDAYLTTGRRLGPTTALAEAEVT
jgi:EAL domain-containing protein (putative c-di-GMP-specific phosphodiesterase class I)